jgi:hypothetical protein
MNHDFPDAHRWLGLCPKAPVIRASQVVIDDSPSTACEGPPDGGAGGPGTIRRGVGAALSGMKTLIHNPQLLWFSLLVGLVLAAHLIAQWVFHTPQWMLYAQRSITKWPFYADSFTAYVLSSLVLTFVIELLTVFCLVFLLAGLILNLASKEGGPVSFFQGLTMAKKYIRPLAGWSVVVAFAGTLLYIASLYSYLLDSTWFQPYNIVWALYRTLTKFLLSVLSQFPFNFVLEPSQYVPILQPGVNWWLISFALEDTLILSAITVFLFVLTLFVVPLLVLERRSLKEAVLGSFTLMKNIWGEVAACVLGLGMVVFAVSLMFLLFQFSGVGYEWWDTGRMYTSFTFPSDAWIAAALLYVLAFSCLTLVVATVGGIASLDLYRYVKTGQKPGSTETEPPA